MCDCGKDKALGEALIALDGAINVLVMARIMVEQQQGTPVDKPVEKVPDPVDGCAHRDVFPIPTASNPAAQMCNECGETL